VNLKGKGGEGFGGREIEKKLEKILNFLRKYFL
jgi:hypothetical protein